MLWFQLFALILALGWMTPCQHLHAEPTETAVAEGHWAGWMIVRPGVSEIDMSVNLSRSEDSTWQGDLSLPIFGVLDFPLGKVEAEGETVLFQYTYSAGTATFEGRVVDGGSRLEGALTERGRTVPVVLERQAAPRSGYPWPEKAEVSRLAGGVEALKAVFNQDQAQTRLLILLSPT